METDSPSQEPDTNKQGDIPRKVDPRFRKYLEPEFTQRLIEHMNKAKQAALKDNETTP